MRALVGTWLSSRHCRLDQRTLQWTGFRIFNDSRDLKDGFFPHRIPGEHLTMALLDQALHEDGQMRKGVVRRDIAQLIAIAQFQEQMEEFGPETQAFLASIPILVPVDQEGLPMKLFQFFTVVPDVHFQAETVDGFLDPERRFGGSPGRDSHWHESPTVERLGRQGFKTGDTGADAFGQFALLFGIAICR